MNEIYDEEAARVLGLFPDQVTVIIHCGSRGFGYQICSDYLDVMDRAVKKYGIVLPDRQLACAPVNSPEGQNYLCAMRSAINYAFANRQVITHHTRKAFENALGMRMADIQLRTVYEVAHNIAKFVRGQSRRTVEEEISEAYKDVSNVVDACALAGISKKVAQLKPLGCIKG